MLKLLGRRLPDGRWVTDSAERNQASIADVLRRILPAEGTVLEVASGTGQHVIFFAREFPGLTWQPSDPDADLRRSIAMTTRMEGSANVLTPLDLDVLRPWPAIRAQAVLCINMVHVAPWEATVAMLAGAAAVIDAGAPLYLYGPYRRGGAHTSPSNEAFDAALRAENSEWGLRDVEAVTAAAEKQGFEPLEIILMPANNLSVIVRRR